MCPYLEDMPPRCGQPPTLENLERALEFCAFDHRQCPSYLEHGRHEPQARQRDCRHRLAAR